MCQSCVKILSSLILFGGLSTGRVHAANVNFDVLELGPGLFRYELIVNNTGGAEPVSGVNVLRGNSVFGLNDSSTIEPPANWSFLPPIAPFVDELSFFSLGSAADIQIDRSLRGFFFVSPIDPGTLKGNDFGVEFIGAVSGSQIFEDVATIIPEPTLFPLVPVALMSALFVSRYRLWSSS